ncbi:MAG: hypothetical protein FWB86_06045 [Treponema sp.]|nr:hypothetical protein [Treponema sp.]
MNDLENYRNIVENIFSQEFKIPVSDNTNNCIGALNHYDSFHVFRENFIERLKRLYVYYEKKPEVIDEILTTLKNIGIKKGYKWSGGYSELVALDYWIQYNNLLNIDFQIKDKKDLYDHSIAKLIGQRELDLDMALDFSSFRVYMDVKSFLPTHVELSDRIFEILKSKTNRNNFLINVDEIYDVDYLELNSGLKQEIKSGYLVNELVKCIDSNETYFNYKLKSGRDLKIRIAYSGKGKGAMLSTTRIIDPYRLAMDYKYKVLDYYNKFIFNDAFFLVFVINPWFNNEITEFYNNNETFYRSLARRVFIELVNDNQNMDKFNDEFTGKSIRVCDIVSLISGIVFIEDKSITLKGNDVYKVYFYTNPNAKNKRVKRFDFDILRWSHLAKQPSIVEDFEFDNY